jgi:glycosyltransferase involved in cell wall biosynthesis
MRILIINENLARGGVPTVIAHWIKTIAGSNISVDLLLHNNIIEYNVLAQIKVLHNHRNTETAVQKLANLFLDKYKLVNIINSYDIILVNADLYQLTIPLMSAINLIQKRIPIIGWVHACLDKVTYYPNNFIKRMHINSLTKMDKIVCVSEVAQQSLINYTNKKINLNRSQVIYNPFDLTIRQFSKRLKVQSGPVNILAVGRFGQEKKFDVLIDAISLVRKRIAVNLTICGDGAEFNNIKNKVAASKLESCITLPGNITDLDLYYQNADIFVSSSMTEALPMVICEALAYSIPVVATQTGAAEVLENGKYGIIVPINNSHALAEAIIKLITNKELSQHYSNTAHQALSKFNPQTILSQWLNLVDSIRAIC